MGALRIASVTVGPSNMLVHTSGASEGIMANALIQNITDEKLVFRVLTSSATSPAESEQIGPFTIVEANDTVEVKGITYGSGQKLFIESDLGNLYVNLNGFTSPN